MQDVFEWKPEYAAGIHSIDGQHRNLFAVAAELHATLTGPETQNKLAVHRLVDRLIRYTVIHFALEERLMLQSHYPGFERHKLEHNGLTEQVLVFQRSYETGHVSAPDQLQFFVEWFGHHIQEMDPAYVPYAKAEPE